MRFGLLEQEDERDNDYPLLMMHTPTTEVPRKPWRLGRVLNQETTPTCVGHAIAGWLMAEPRCTVAGVDAHRIYQVAQRFDGIAMPHDGTTLRAGMKALQRLGKVERYLWTRELDVILWWLRTHGTILIGSPWYERMDTPTEKGQIIPRGKLLGHHAWLLTWFDEEKERIRMRNSWGTRWGIRGNGFVYPADLDRLLSIGAYACAAIEAPKRINLANHQVWEGLHP